MFLCESCSVRSALALLTSTSEGGQKVTVEKKGRAGKEKKEIVTAAADFFCIISSLRLQVSALSTNFTNIFISI